MGFQIQGNKIRTDLIKQIEELSQENIYACYFCGKCSAGCPIAEYMDILPHMVVRYLQIGDYEKVINCNAMWYCSTCLQCGTKCPKDVDISKIMDSLREIVKRKGISKMDLSKINEEMWGKIPQQAIVSAFRKYET